MAFRIQTVIADPEGQPRVGRSHFEPGLLDRVRLGSPVVHGPVLVHELVFEELFDPNGSANTTITSVDAGYVWATEVSANALIIVDVGRLVSGVWEPSGTAGDVDPSTDRIGHADGCICRVEVLDSQVLYSTCQRLVDGVFNYCAIGRRAAAAEPALELAEADPGAAAHAVAAAGLAEADLASAEYLLDAGSGAPVFIDFNPYSNLISGFDDELGFSPLDRLADAIENRASR